MVELRLRTLGLGDGRDSPVPRESITLNLRNGGEDIVGRASEVQLKKVLARRLDQLLELDGGTRKARATSASAQSVQQAILEVSRKLNRPGWLAYLVGGTLRDLLVGPESDHDVHPRDIDIIVDGATRGQLQEALGESLTLERFTRFGGLHLSGSLASGSAILFDVWTLADNWGFHSQKIAPRIEDFPGTTFLNIDSCATELVQRQGRERALYEKGFFKSIADRVLDVNYAPNPYPYVCVARSLVLAAQLNFAIARPLAGFILDHTAAGGIDALLEAQRSHYGSVRSDAKELETWLHDYRRQFESGQDLIHIDIANARRMELWKDHPVAKNHSRL